MKRSHIIRTLALGAGALLVAAAAAPVTPASAAGGGVRHYFVDCAQGSDAGPGTPGRPWRTLARVNTTQLKPGDAVRLRAGTTCTGTLAPRGSGTPRRPITLGAYGVGSAPHIDGGGARAAVFLHNVQGWELRDLRISNAGPPPTAGQQRVGLYVLLEDFGIGRHYKVSRVSVHDVNGCDCRFPGPSGGIVFEAGGASVPTGFDGITVRDNAVSTVDRIGIGTFSSWQRRDIHPEGPGTSFMAITGVTMERNRLTDIGGDGVAILNGVGARVRHNVIDGYNTRSLDYNVGMYAWNSDRTLFEYNEVAGGRGVGMAFALEGANDGTVYQYNLTRDNGGGFLYACNSDGSTSRNGVVRYNISQNDVGGSNFFGIFTLLCDPQPNTVVHNNTFYAPTSERIVNNAGTTAVRFVNNVFVGRPAGSVIRDPHGDYAHNLYQNVPAPPGDTAAVTGAPMLAAPGTASSLASTDGYLLLAGSPALGAGMAVPGVRRDFFGNPVPAGGANIGAYQGPGR
jgi:hypothetical protein